MILEQGFLLYIFWVFVTHPIISIIPVRQKIAETLAMTGFEGDLIELSVFRFRKNFIEILLYQKYFICKVFVKNCKIHNKPIDIYL